MNITLYKNIFAKICALLFAVFLWFFVMNEQNPPVESTFTVPLEVSNNLEGYSVDYNIENVKIKVRTPAIGPILVPTVAPAAENSNPFDKSKTAKASPIETRTACSIN